MSQVAALYRYPIKSMQGEAVDQLELTPSGVVGDRALALLDLETGLVVSAHRPDRWGAMLRCQARWSSDGIVVTLPDESSHQPGPELERRLGDLLDRPVRFIQTAPPEAKVDFTLADVPESAPDSFAQWVLSMAGSPNDTIGRLPVGLGAPAGSLVDVAPVHIITEAALRALADGGGDPDIRRFRPNIVTSSESEGYAENAWLDHELDIGTARLRVTGPTMRCLVTTLPQAGGIQPHRANLTTLVRDNRLTYGPGSWACLGVYATPESEARIGIGDQIAVSRAASSTQG